MLLTHYMQNSLKGCTINNQSSNTIHPTLLLYQPINPQLFTQ